MAQRQLGIAEVEQTALEDAERPEITRGDDFSREFASLRELLGEVLKELRQIRGILGRMAAETAPAHSADDDRQ